MNKYEVALQRLYPESLLISHCEINSKGHSFEKKTFEKQTKFSDIYYAQITPKFML